MMGPSTAPQQRKGPEQNVPLLAAVDSTGRGRTSQPAPPHPMASHSLQNQDRIDDGDQEKNVDRGGRKKRTPRSESNAVQDGEFVMPALGEVRNTHMEGSPRTRSPRKQQMAAEGTVTCNRSKKNVGAAVVPTSQHRGQTKDNLCAGGGGAANNKVVQDGGGGGDDKGAKGVVAAKDKRTRAWAKDVFALGGNTAVDKCARGGGDRKSNPAPREENFPRRGIGFHLHCLMLDWG